MRIRELLESDPESFYSGAIAILKKADDSRGSQYLVELLVSYNLLLRALCDPEFTREQCKQVASLAARFDPMADVALARQLADGATLPESTMRAEETGRVIEILSEISDGTRILPSLMRLLRHNNPYVRSKVVKMVGRGNGSVKWVRNRLTESDSRIRANAIEALWGVDTEEARELLQTAALDGNNRVAGNALLGLYRLGDCASIADLIKLSEHDSTLFRCTAAWAMGQTGDPRFGEALARMMREPNRAVRGGAMAALGKIKIATALSRQKQKWLASASLLEYDPRKSGSGFRLALTAGENGAHCRILPTHVILTEDSQNVTNYKVVERLPAEAVSVIFMFPRIGIPANSAWTRGALKCLAAARPSDLWAVEYYLTEPSTSETPEAEIDGPRYTGNLKTFTAALNTPPMRNSCLELWQSIWHAVRADRAPLRGRRHVILFSNGSTHNRAGDGLVSAVRASGASVQAIATTPNSELEGFCKRVRGSVRIAETDEAIEDAIYMAYVNLLARYEITYQSVNPSAQKLRVRVNSPGGWADTCLDLPGVSPSTP